MKKNKSLGSLIGKTIIDVEVVDYDHLHRERVDELYRVTCSDGEVMHFLCDGGDCSHYGTLSRVELDENRKVTGRYNPDLASYIGEFESLKEREESE